MTFKVDLAKSGKFSGGKYLTEAKLKEFIEKNLGIFEFVTV